MTTTDTHTPTATQMTPPPTGTQRRRIAYVPTVSVDAEVSLDEFDTADIIKYLKDKGADADFGGTGCSESGLYISPADLDRIETLSICGQGAIATAFAMQLISEAIGRKV